MHIERTRPSSLFIVTGGGAGLAPEAPCTHGLPSMSLHLLSNRGRRPKDIGIIIPSCATAQLVGAALAFLQAHSGEEAADEFVRELLAARDEVVHRLAAENVKPCCQASLNTQGREHTCDTRPAR